ncbi:MAG: tetratricopeptide repeat protein, partial [Gammaproteobacteria bacterium]|nr:tetratricopeptide repeat protein [Gammaproteobacteria bacterium]
MDIQTNITGSSKRSTAFIIGWSGLFLLLFGCTNMLPGGPAAEISPDSLLAGVALGAIAADSKAETLINDADILGLSPQMSVFIDQNIDRDTNDYQRIRQLIFALMGDGSFRLQYNNQTQTATETFNERHGNCLSFTNLFVAMARDIELKVSYQEVDIPPDWTTNDGTFTLNRHVNVHVDLGMAGGHVVDFNIGDFRTTYDRRIISDERALAHFFNNKGVEHLQDGDTGAALANLQRALHSDRTFAPAWSNLGTLYRRQGLLVHAEASYLQSLAVNSSEYVAMSNLASLYTQTGDSERAALFEKKVRRHRMRNPYYRFDLAKQAFLQRDYDTAISNLEFAIRRKELEDSFHFLLGLSYLQKGDEKKARKLLQKAEELAQSDALKRNYQSKIDL